MSIGRKSIFSTLKVPLNIVQDVCKTVILNVLKAQGIGSMCGKDYINKVRLRHGGRAGAGRL